jgi:hypothetical protein
MSIAGKGGRITTIFVFADYNWRSPSGLSRLSRSIEKRGQPAARTPLKQSK